MKRSRFGEEWIGILREHEAGGLPSETPALEGKVRHGEETDR
jgi:hypothetical protein